MNKKDISEIKKTLKPENSSIELIRTCYVNGEKKIVASHKSSFLSLDEEEQHKYMDILKKAMSGKLNLSLLNLEFPNEAEQDGGTQNRLYKMMKDGLEDDDMTDLFFEELVNTYVHTGNYLILLAYGNYGIPSRASDGADLGESEYVYSFFICCLCPVDLSKPGLCYSHDDKTFVNAERDWIAGNPEVAFTFPAFSDRQMDIHHALYYTKKATEPHEEISDTILGCVLPMAADDQKEAFKEMVQESLGENANIHNIVNLNREIESYVDDMERDDETPIMNGKDVANLLSRSGVDSDIKSEEFEVMADVVADEKYIFEAEGMKLQVSKDFIDFVEQKTVNGRPCLVLPLSGTTLNGIKLFQKIEK